MSTEPAPSARESSLATILLAPFRALEQARGWRRLGLLAVHGLIVLAIGGLLWRRAQFAGLPDVGEPFDVAAQRALARIADDRNAFVAYRRAAGRFRDMNPAEGASFSNADLTWSRADPTLRGWIAEHAEAIALIREGSGRPDASLEASASPAGPLATSEKLEVLRRLSGIGNAALFEAGRGVIRPGPGPCSGPSSAPAGTGNGPSRRGRRDPRRSSCPSSPGGRSPGGPRTRRSARHCSGGPWRTWSTPRPSRRRSGGSTARNTWGPRSRWPT